MNTKTTMLFAVGFVLSGCFAEPNMYLIQKQNRIDRPSFSQGTAEQLSSTTYAATDKLMSAPQHPIHVGAPLLVASLVNVDDVDSSSTFGRIVAEQVSGRLAQLGFLMSEPKLRDTLVINKYGGELILSRDLMKIGKAHNAQAVVAGTYALGGQYIHVNLRLIALESGHILNAVDYAVPIGSDTRRMVFALNSH